MAVPVWNVDEKAASLGNRLAGDVGVTNRPLIFSGVAHQIGRTVRTVGPVAISCPRLSCC